MSKTHRDRSNDQAYLFPPSPQDRLPEGDLVYFLTDTIATLDLPPTFAHYEPELRGRPPFHPRMMVALLSYCYATGTRSSRRVMICALAGLAGGGTIALDGTKVKADASRHEAMGHDRMRSEEAGPQEEIAELPDDARAADEAEDLRHGPDRQGDELPGELARRQGRLAKVREARRLLEERARIEAAEEAARRQAEGRSPPVTPPAEAAPDPEGQINFTDPESRIMRASSEGWDRCGNARAVVDERQIIPAADVTDRADDVRQTVPMADQTRANPDAAGVRGATEAASGDAGHCGEADAAALEQRGGDPRPATERLKHHEKVAPAPRGRAPQGLTAKRRMARKLGTRVGRERYAKRKGMIEPIFGRLERVLGFRQLSLRGLSSMRGERRLMATVHDLSKLWRHDQGVEMAG